MKTPEKDGSRLERRNFVKAVATGSVSTALLGAAVSASAFGSSPSLSTEPAAARKKVLMKLGCQYGGTTVENLEFKARHGVFNINGGWPKLI